MTCANKDALVEYLSQTYRWAPERIREAIIKFADYFGKTREVYYAGGVNVEVRHLSRGRYSVSEIPLQTLARSGGVGYTSSLDRSRNVTRTTQEAPMATRTARPAAKAAATRRKAAPEPEPEVEEQDDELEDELEDEEEEELDDEAEESDEDDEEQDEDEDDEEVDDEADADEDAPDYTVYASKSITPTMSDFHEWLNDEVGDLSEMDTERIVALAGTLRMEFQRSQFCKDRRAERQASRTKPAAKPAAKAAPAKSAPTKTAPATSTKPAVVKGGSRSAAATGTATRATAGSTGKARPGTAVGKPAARTADRPAAKPAATTRKVRRGSAEPF